MTRTRVAVAAVPAAALTSVIAFAPQVLTRGPVLCPFRRLTGHACPTCGMTRACVAALRGDVAASFAAHPLAVPLLLAALVYLLYQAGQSMRSEPVNSGSNALLEDEPLGPTIEHPRSPASVHSE
jgi:hypothetical protein